MSIFSLPTEASHLRAWGDRQHQQAGTQQHASIANVVGTQFGNQDIRIPFQVAGNRWWVPSKSYVRIRVRIRRQGGVASLTNLVAPQQDFASCLFQSCEFAIRGVTVSRLANYVTQVSQYQQRTKQSKATLDCVNDGMGPNEHSWERRRQSVSLIPTTGIVDVETIDAVALRDVANVAVTVDRAASLADGTSIWTFAGHKGSLDNFVNVGDTVIAPDGAEGVAFVVAANALTVRGGLIAADGGGVAYPAGATFLRRNLGDRVVQVGADVFDVLWQPPLSIFGIDHALPSMACELVLKGWPDPIYSRAALASRPGSLGIEPTDQLVIGRGAGQYDVSVESLFFFSYQVVSDRMSDGSFFLDLEDTNCIAVNYPVSDSLQQLQFMVHPSTFQLGFALQDARAGTTTQYPLAHLGYFDTTGAGGVVKSAFDLERMFIQYANMTFPQPDVQQQYTNDALSRTNQLRQQWLETQLATNQMFTPGGCETFRDWMNNGPLYVYQTQRDGTDRSSNVQVNCKLANLHGPAGAFNINALLFSVSRRAVTIHVSNGAVTEVLVQDQ